MGIEQGPKKKEVGALKNETRIAMPIHCTLYSMLVAKFFFVQSCARRPES